MSVLQPAAGEPRRPSGPRDPGDAWVVAPDGTKYWGRFGAAGLLAHDPGRGVLLQLRVSWSHFPHTWGLPGGALQAGESAIDGALREAFEEAAVPRAVIRPLVMSRLELEFWAYTTLVGQVMVPFEPQISDPESQALEWVPVDQVANRPLHPGFADSWPVLRRLLNRRPVIMVDAANVVGARPDGWWKDRAGATQRFLTRIGALADQGLAGIDLEDPQLRWFPDWVVVVEGQARAVVPPVAITVVRAPGSGDDSIVAQVQRLMAAGRQVIVVTSDRELGERARRAGAGVRGANWLWQQLD